MQMFRFILFILGVLIEQVYILEFSENTSFFSYGALPQHMGPILWKTDLFCFFEWDTCFWQRLPAVSRWRSQIRLQFSTSSTDHLHFPTHIICHCVMKAPCQSATWSALLLALIISAIGWEIFTLHRCFWIIETIYWSRLMYHYTPTN